MIEIMPPISRVPNGEFVLCFDKDGQPVVISGQSPPVGCSWTAGALCEAMVVNGLLSPLHMKPEAERTGESRTMALILLLVWLIVVAVAVWRVQVYLDHAERRIEDNVREQFKKHMREEDRTRPRF